MVNTLFCLAGCQEKEDNGSDVSWANRLERIYIYMISNCEDRNERIQYRGFDIDIGIGIDIDIDKIDTDVAYFGRVYYSLREIHPFGCELHIYIYIHM